ncbi:hypothetical protein [Desertivirga brevis]|uniref:hypothetical protein n=1 Tax=Desertivirga brevis TaxID=2810310 RepID=UPI001A9571A8|nr:hypothetical protein [Pedobacter sp. SYSU D00873]
MGTFKKNKLKGKIGKVVSREFLGIEVVQAAPGSYENTVSSHISALEKGIASTSGKIIRELFLPLNCKFDTRMYTRFAGSLRKCIHESKSATAGRRDLHDGDLSNLIGFQLNEFSILSEVMSVRPKAELLPDSRIRVNIDNVLREKNIKNVPPYTDLIIRFLCFAVNFRHERMRFLNCKDFTFGSGGILEAQEFFINIDVPDGTLLFVTCSLHVIKNLGITGYETANTKNFSPAEIIGAWNYADGKSDHRDFNFSNADIDNEHYRWEEILGYEGKRLLEKAAEILEKSGQESNTKEKKPKEKNPFPFPQ